MTESRSEIVFEALPVDDPQVRQPDITRAKQLLGWEPAVTLREGLRRTIDRGRDRAAGRRLELARCSGGLRREQLDGLALSLERDRGAWFQLHS